MKVVVMREMRRFSPWRWLAGLGAGAGLMYVLDPSSGRRRRALLRDKARHTARLTGDTVRRTVADVRHRAEGLVATTEAVFESGPVHDAVLVERVRSKLGRLVAHPRAIDVTSHDGVVTLSGPILRHEARRLVRRIAVLPGVRTVEDNLEHHARPAGVPALQGGAHLRTSPAAGTWSPAEQLLAGMAGVGLGLWGLRAGGLRGGIAAGLGAGLLVRATTNMPVRRLVGIGAGRRAVDVQKAIHIEAPVETVYEFLSDLQHLPQFMSHVTEVRDVGDGRMRWTVTGPAGIPVHFDVVSVEREPGRRIAWESAPNAAIRSVGTIHFEPAETGTRVQVRMSYNPPAGAVGHAVASLLGASPKKALDDDLLRLKSLLEHGKARAHGETVTREEARTHPSPGPALIGAPRPSGLCDTGRPRLGLATRNMTAAGVGENRAQPPCEPNEGG